MNAATAIVWLAGIVTLFAGCAAQDGLSVSSASIDDGEPQSALLDRRPVASGVPFGSVFVPHENMMLIRQGGQYSLGFRESPLTEGVPEDANDLETRLGLVLPRLRTGDFDESPKVFTYPVSYPLDIDETRARRIEAVLATAGTSLVAISWDMDRSVTREKGTTPPTHGGGPGGEVYDRCVEELVIRFQIALSDAPELGALSSTYVSSAQRVSVRETTDIEACLRDWVVGQN